MYVDFEDSLDDYATIPSTTILLEGREEIKKIDALFSEWLKASPHLRNEIFPKIESHFLCAPFTDNILQKRELLHKIDAIASEMLKFPAKRPALAKEVEKLAAEFESSSNDSLLPTTTDLKMVREELQRMLNLFSQGVKAATNERIDLLKSLMGTPPTTEELLAIIEQFKKVDGLLSVLLDAPAENRMNLALEFIQEELKHLIDLVSQCLKLPANERVALLKPFAGDTPPTTAELLEALEVLKKVDDFLPILIAAPNKDKMDLIMEFVMSMMMKNIEPMPPNVDNIERVREIRTEMTSLREEVRNTLCKVDRLFQYTILANGTVHVDPSLVAPISAGISGSYFLLNEGGEILYVVKPLDEDIGGFNNKKGFAGFDTDEQFFDGIEIYSSVFRENAISQISEQIAVQSIAPRAFLAVVDCDKFYDIADKQPELGPSDKEKLCSLMEYVPNSQPIYSILQTMQWQGKTNEEIAALFNQSEMEDANILIWTSGDIDKHGANILGYQKDDGTFGIKLIDNGLAFPTENNYIRNFLSFMPNANQPLSDRAREKILSMDVTTLAATLNANRLEKSVDAMKARVERLKTIALNHPSLTLGQINTYMSDLKLELPHA